jgi:hypothetical protein
VQTNAVFSPVALADFLRLGWTDCMRMAEPGWADAVPHTSGWLLLFGVGPLGRTGALDWIDRGAGLSKDENPWPSTAPTASR